MIDSDDDPTVELEQLSEAACAEFMRAYDAAIQPNSVSGTGPIQLDGVDVDSGITEDMAAAIRELRDELKFRDEMNTILQLGVDQQREKCQSLEEQISGLERVNEDLRHELEQSRELAADAEQKIAMAQHKEETLLNNLKEQDKEDAAKAALLERLKSSEAEADDYKKEIAALRRQMSRASGPRSPDKGPVVPRVPAGPEEAQWVLAALEGDESETHPVRDGIVTIGSSPDNDIHIQSQFVSHHHAQLIKTHKGCVVRDLGSMNGTFINSRRINKRILKAGDTVTIGKHRFRYEYLGPEPVPSDVRRHGHSLN